jgi:hypothetical protein
MKILDTPRVNKLGTAVAYQGRNGLCLRTLVIPQRTVTAARERVWGSMAYFSRAWSLKLTQQQQERWIVAAGSVLSRSTLNQCGPLTGEQFFIQVNLARSCIGLGPLWEPPARETFTPSPVAELSVVNGAQGLRLLLAVTGPVTEAIMVFGQAPCSTGRHKRRNVAYLGLLPPPENGASDITDLYVAKYGPLSPHTKIFIVTRQQRNGWEGPLKETNAIVPRDEGGSHSPVNSPPSDVRKDVPVKPEAQQAPAEGALPSIRHMHTGCTRGAQGTVTPPAPCSPGGSKAAEPGGEATKSCSEGGGGGGGTGVK